MKAREFTSSGWKNEARIFNKYTDNDNIKDGRRNGSASLLSIKTRPKQHVTWAVGGDDKKPSQASLGPVSYLQMHFTF